MGSQVSRLVLLLALLLFAVGCSKETSQDAPDVGYLDAGEDVADNQVEAPPNYDIASGPLEVGFGRAAAPWRVGAKPGQVGTSALPGLEETLLGNLTSLVPILRSSRGPAYILEGATEWALEILEREAEETYPGEYAMLFESGRGIETAPDVRAVVVRRGDLKVALVRADIYLMHEYLHRRVADLVANETGLSREQIFLTGTHNHSAPQPSFPAPGVWSLADGFDPRHFVYISHKIAAAIIEANENLEPARLRVQRTEFRDVQFNIIGPRTITMAKDGESEPEEIHVGYPREHFDGDLDLLYFDRADAPHEPLGLLFVFGMHPETLPSGHGLTSGEFPVHVEQRLEHRLGMETMWIPGPLGDIEPDSGQNNAEHRFWRQSFDALHHMSAVIAAGVEERLQALLEDDTIRPEVEPAFRNIARDIPGTEDFPLPTSAYLAGLRLPTPRILHGSSLTRLHAIRLGDALFLGLPAEVTTDLAVNIKSRIGEGFDEVYQGYVFDENPEWVAERVMQNFTTTTVEEAHRAPVPIVVSMANGYIGYVVSRWEYENREHYRMHMTPLGPGTADHLAKHLVMFVDEMMGGEVAKIEMPDWLETDLEGVETLMGFFEGLDERVRQMQRSLPPGTDVPGEVLQQPTHLPAQAIDPRHATHDAVVFAWRGASADMTPPTVYLELEVEGEWEIVEKAPGMAMHLFFDAPDEWTLRWYPAYSLQAVGDDAPLRFRVAGTYRSSETGVSPADFLWDPDGANQIYTLESSTFRLDELEN